MTKLELRILLITVVSVASIGLVAFFVGFAALFYGYLSEPRTTIHVHNDSNLPVQIVYCNDDPQEISPGKTLAIDVISRTPMRACEVYMGGEFEGCLYLPADTYPAGSHVKASQMVRGVSETECINANK